jgi:hypothetical protein
MLSLIALILFLSLSLIGSKISWAGSPLQEGGVKQLIPASNWQKQFKITDGKDLGNVVPLTSVALSDEKRWKLVFGDYAGIYLVQETSGEVIIERLDLFKSRNSIIYEPALPIVPSDINSANLLRRETGYQMFNLDTGKLKRAGRVTHLLQPASASQFDTPAGRLDGHYLEIDHIMEMEYRSQLHLKLGLGYRLNEGPIHGWARYSVTKLGVFTATRTAGAALFTK